MKKGPPRFIEFVSRFDRMQDAADALGVTPGFVSQVIHGKSAVPAKRAIQWSEQIGCLVEELRPDMISREGRRA